ncbi:ribonuclease S-2-like [Lycium barbarum]|uniref:ribonuclease S-2-like n=1 Tax=Lycium barbarum TaxID=112863 RepID=UPI00293ED7D6|nr:ribonuclease S-2-like [Lycium barbarum]
MKLLLIIFMFNTLVPQMFSQANYAKMQYVLQWNPSFCESTQYTCKSPIPQNFTIHGLWPATATGSGLLVPQPQYPNDWQIVKQDMALVTQDQNLVNNLRHVWPTVVRSNTDEGFWKYEWETHGFGMRTQIDVRTYFEAATRIHAIKIAINGKTNLKDYFSNAGIQPGQFVTRSDIGNALAPIVRGINIKCYDNGTYIFVKEVILCLDSPLQNFVSCDPSRVNVGGGVKLLGICNYQKLLYFPA